MLEENENLPNDYLSMCTYILNASNGENSDYKTFLPSSCQEFSLEKAMHTMMETWDSVSFNTSIYRETGVRILSSVDEIQTILDDQIVKTQTMRGSPFIKPFEKEIKV